MDFCYVVPNDELTHFGILGMHWGIRRYQPYSSNPRKSGKTGREIQKAAERKAKAKIWKARESQQQSEYYDRKIKQFQDYAKSKESKISSLKKDGDSKEKIKKIQSKIDSANTQVRIHEKLKNAELNKIKKMSVDDVDKARIQKGARTVGTVLAKTGLAVVSATALNAAIDSFKKAAPLYNQAKEYKKRSESFAKAGSIYGRGLSTPTNKEELMDKLYSRSQKMVSAKYRLAAKQAMGAAAELALYGLAGTAIAGTSMAGLVKKASHYSTLTTEEQSKIIRQNMKKKK